MLPVLPSDWLSTSTVKGPELLMVIGSLPPELVANRLAVAVSSAIPAWPLKINEPAVTTAPPAFVMAPWLKRPSLLILAGATEEETFKVVPP